MEKINIVVCSNNTEYKVAVKNKIVDENYSIIGYSEIENGAKTRIHGFVPDVVAFLLDSDEIDSSFLDFVEDLNLNSIGACAVILTNRISVDLVNNAAQVGVRQVMDISIGGEEFCKNISKIVSKERKLSQSVKIDRKVRSMVYAFFSGKGGVGKTTICTNTAVSLASRGKKTLLIDLDLQFGDADMALDVSPSETIVDLVRDTNGVSIDNLTTCCTSHLSGLSLLASPNSPELAEYVSADKVKAIIDIARSYYEYIIVDCGCALTDPVITAIESSDTVFMVNDVNILSLKRAKLCLDVLTQLNQKEKIKMIINRYAKKNAVKIQDFENLLGIPAYAVISADFKTVNTSLNNGQPVVSYKPRAVISRELNSFVSELVFEREGNSGKAKGKFSSRKKNS
ncbi:MAG: CpaE family protein [Eubacterium sp.]